MEHKRRRLENGSVEPARRVGAASPDVWRDFAGWLQTQLQRTMREYNWFAENSYTEVEAAIEAELETGPQRRRLARVESLQAALQQTSSRLVLVEGAPGSGKSVALRQLASSLLGDAAGTPHPSSPIPIYVNLREWQVGASQVGPDNLKQEIRRQLAQGHPEWSRFIDERFAAGLQDGRWLILLDSFDEIPEILSSTDPDDDVSKYAEAIDEFAYGMQRCRVIVASRPYRGPGRMPWPRFRLVATSEASRLQMIRTWFDDDDELARRILGEIVSAPALAEWTRNPLLLSIVCAYRKAEDA